MLVKIPFNIASAIIENVDHGISVIWKKTMVPYSGTFTKTSNQLDYYSRDYSIPDNWKKTFEEDLIYPSNLISAGFELN